MANSTIIDGLLRARLLVAALGERLPEPWWRSQFLTPTGLSIGQRIFPRSSGVAALSSATVAARRDHDEKTGLQSFHLFRFPTSIEHQLVDAANALDDWQLPEDAEAIVQVLQDMSGGCDVKFKAGPKSLGEIKELSKASTPRVLAFLYAQSAKRMQRAYPYFEAASDE